MNRTLGQELKEFDLTKCVQCGKCTASCTSGRDSNLRTRRLVFLVKSGRDVSSDKDLWACTTCYTCQERCPKGVKVTDAIIRIRNSSARAGNRPSIHLTAIRSLLESSDGFPITPDVSKIRSMIGLPIAPVDVAHDEAERERFRKLVSALAISGMAKEG
ncbi:MAG TPA: 4Fe-4S dicluster domain-containing protein [Methanomassiliicoccales archaeon]|nr:4Fe-4S dicluster domain-containing protein [Methanomassiliicoccales archaeon]